jgi:hypothetical protein
MRISCSSLKVDTMSRRPFSAVRSSRSLVPFTRTRLVC